MYEVNFFSEEAHCALLTLFLCCSACSCTCNEVTLNIVEGKVVLFLMTALFDDSLFDDNNSSSSSNNPRGVCIFTAFITGIGVIIFLDCTVGYFSVVASVPHRLNHTDCWY